MKGILSNGRTDGDIAGWERLTGVMEIGDHSDPIPKSIHWLTLFHKVKLEIA
jgi:hypothetical protein